MPNPSSSNAKGQQQPSAGAGGAVSADDDRPAQSNRTNFAPIQIPQPRSFNIPISALQSPQIRALIEQQPDINGSRAAVWKGNGVAVSVVSPELSFVNISQPPSAASLFGMNMTEANPFSSSFQGVISQQQQQQQQRQAHQQQQQLQQERSNSLHGVVPSPTATTVPMAFMDQKQTKPQVPGQLQGQVNRRPAEASRVVERNPFSTPFQMENAKRGAGNSSTLSHLASGDGLLPKRAKQPKRASSTQAKQETASNGTRRSTKSQSSKRSNAESSNSSSSNSSSGGSKRKQTGKSGGGTKSSAAAKPSYVVNESPLPGESIEQTKKRVRKEKNRIAAAACRQRKLDTIAKLSAKLAQMQEENESLQSEYAVLEQEFVKLKEDAIEHLQASCKGIEYQRTTPSSSSSLCSFVLPAAVDRTGSTSSTSSGNSATKHADAGQSATPLSRKQLNGRTCQKRDHMTDAHQQQKGMPASKAAAPSTRSTRRTRQQSFSASPAPSATMVQ